MTCEFCRRIADRGGFVSRESADGLRKCAHRAAKTLKTRSHVPAAPTFTDDIAKDGTRNLCIPGIAQLRGDRPAVQARLAAGLPERQRQRGVRRHRDRGFVPAVLEHEAIRHGKVTANSAARLRGHFGRRARQSPAVGPDVSDRVLARIHFRVERVVHVPHELVVRCQCLRRRRRRRGSRVWGVVVIAQHCEEGATAAQHETAPRTMAKAFLWDPERAGPLTGGFTSVHSRPFQYRWPASPLGSGYQPGRLYGPTVGVAGTFTTVQLWPSQYRWPGSPLGFGFQPGGDVINVPFFVLARTTRLRLCTTRGLMRDRVHCPAAKRRRTPAAVHWSPRLQLISQPV